MAEVNTYYIVPDDKAMFKCWECGKYDKANEVVFVKLTDTFGVRHATCVENLSMMTKIEPPKF